MATFKKSKLRKAEDGISADYKERQGNYSKGETKSPPNKFPEAKAPEAKKETLKPETALTLKKATGNQLIERAKAVTPPSVYTRPGKGVSSPLGNRPPAKTAAAKKGGSFKKKK